MDYLLQRFKARIPARRHHHAAQDDLVKRGTYATQPRQPDDRQSVAPQDHPIEQRLSALLLEHIGDTDRRTRGLAQRFDTLLEMLFAGGDVDARATVELIAELGRLHREELAEVRRCIELMVKITRPTPPSVRVVGAQVNMAGAQQITGPRKD